MTQHLDFAPTAALAAGLAEQRYVSLLGDEVRQHMAVLRHLMQPLQSGLPADLNAMAAQTRLLDHLLQEISDLSQVMQRDDMFNEDRIDLTGLVEQTVTALNQQQQTHTVLTIGPARPGVIYGNARWLQHALRALLNTLCLHAPPLTHLSVTLHQMGEFVVLTGKVMNQSVHLPSPDDAPDSAGQPAQPGVGQPTGSLLLARRIVELHVGKLKLTYRPSAQATDPRAPPIEAFTVTLATGQPALQRKRLSCVGCPTALQAQIYAQDMATLLTDNPTP